MQLRADGKSEHTRGAYVKDLQQFRYWLGREIEVRNINPSRLARYFASDTLKDRKPVSLNRTKTALRMLFKFLADAGYLEANPARLIKNGRTEPKTPEYFKPAEARSFLTAIPTNDGPEQAEIVSCSHSYSKQASGLGDW